MKHTHVNADLVKSKEQSSEKLQLISMYHMANKVNYRKHPMTKAEKKKLKKAINNYPTRNHAPYQPM